MKLTLLALAALAIAASASAATLPGFRSPTGNIRCSYNPHGLTARGFTPVVRCGLDRASYATRLQSRCKAGDWHGFSLTPSGRPLLYCPGGAARSRARRA